MPDSACATCRSCNAPFTFFNRRHHCRACFYIFCGDCSSSFVTIPPLIKRGVHHLAPFHAHPAHRPLSRALTIPDFAFWLANSVKNCTRRKEQQSRVHVAKRQKQERAQREREIRAHRQRYTRQREDDDEEEEEEDEEGCEDGTGDNIFSFDEFSVLGSTSAVSNTTARPIATTTASTMTARSTTNLTRNATSHSGGALCSDGLAGLAGSALRHSTSVPLLISRSPWDFEAKRGGGEDDEDGGQEEEEDAGASLLLCGAPMFSPCSGQTNLFNDVENNCEFDVTVELSQSHLFSTASGLRERVCNRCKDIITRVTASEGVIRMLLSNPYIDLLDFKVLKCVSKTTRAAVEFLEKKWSKLGQNRFDLAACRSPVANALLSQNAHLIRDHPSWEILAASAGCYPSDAKLTAAHMKTYREFAQRLRQGGWRRTAKHYEFGTTREICDQLRCKKICNPVMLLGQCITVILRLPRNSPLRAKAFQRLIAATDQLETTDREQTKTREKEEKKTRAKTKMFPLIPFVPSLIWMSMDEPDVLQKVIIPTMKKDNEFAYLAYFCARGHPHLRFIKAALYKVLAPEQRKEVASSEFFLNAILHLLNPSMRPSERLSAIDAHVLAQKPFLPGSARFRVVSIDTRTVKQLTSSTYPWVMQCEIEDVQENIVETRTVMVKPESVWNDLTVMLVQRYLLSLDPSLELEPYLVTPLGISQGLVMFVKGCKSLFEIEKNGTIMTWLSDSHQTKCSADIQKTFMRSCAITCVLSLLLGFGDRHLQNILCSGATGRLIHIDYGFLWSEEPTVSRHRFWLPEQIIRLTPGMLQVFQTHFYRDFLSLCASINRMVRSVAVDLYYICWALIPVGSTDEYKMRAHFTSFLLPYTMNASDADAAIVNVIEHETKTSSTPFSSIVHKFMKYLDQ